LFLRLPILKPQVQGLSRLYDDKLSGTRVADDDKISLKQKSNGDTVTKATKGVTLNTATNYTLQVSYSAGVIEIFLNGSSLLTVSTNVVPFGNFGFRVKAGSARFEEIVVQ
jgi:hypothetical protein